VNERRKGKIMRIRSLDDVKELNREGGFHYFDRDTLQFFGSRIGETVYPSLDGQRACFVTSEYTGWDRAGRRYSVRMIDQTGDVSNISEFLQYATRNGAHAAARRHARTLVSAS
jgi:hypothetical protein